MNNSLTDEAGRKFYITTAIDYPNGVPTIGHSLEKVAADVIARYHRLLGDDTYFSMGLDENSQHVTKAAQAHGVDTITWINHMDEAFRLAWNAAGHLQRLLDSHHRGTPCASFARDVSSSAAAWRHV